MNVLFVYPERSIHPHWRGSFHFGIAWISAVLKRVGHDTSLIHLTERVGETEFIARMEQSHPFDMVAFSATTNDFKYVVALSSWVKKYFNVPTICGGAHVMVDPESVINVPAIDFGCVGEGEQTMVELCHQLEHQGDISRIESLWLKAKTGVIRNPTRPLLENLDSLPFPDRDLFNYQSLEDATERRLTILASRGCPYKCTYCCNHAIRSLYPNKGAYVRFRSSNNVVDEIEECLRKYPWVERIVFHDDILTMRKDCSQHFQQSIVTAFACLSLATQGQM